MKLTTSDMEWRQCNCMSACWRHRHNDDDDIMCSRTRLAQPVDVLQRQPQRHGSSSFQTCPSWCTQTHACPQCPVSSMRCPESRVCSPPSICYVCEWMDVWMCECVCVGGGGLCVCVCVLHVCVHVCVCVSVCMCVVECVHKVEKCMWDCEKWNSYVNLCVRELRGGRGEGREEEGERGRAGQRRQWQYIPCCVHQQIWPLSMILTEWSLETSSCSQWMSGTHKIPQ